jgi:hypothetical protein
MYTSAKKVKAPKKISGNESCDEPSAKALNKINLADDAVPSPKKAKKPKADDAPVSVETAAAAVPVAADGDNIDNDGEGEDAADDGAKRKRKRNRSRKKPAKEDEAPAAAAAPPADATAKAAKAGSAPAPSIEGTVYVEGISYDADDDDVRTLFEQVGVVVAVRMPRWHDSNKPRGYAHVVFKDATHVAAAIAQLNGQRLMGRYLKVAEPNAPKIAAVGPSAPPPEGPAVACTPFRLRAAAAAAGTAFAR